MSRRVLPGRRRDRGERGASAVEFALLLLPLMLILLGIIAYGMMLTTRQNLSQAAAEGARAAAVQVNASNRQSAALKAVNASMSTSDLTCGSGGLTCSVRVAACSNDASASCASVTVTYAYASHAPIQAPIISDVLPDTLSFTATARVS